MRTARREDSDAVIIETTMRLAVLLTAGVAVASAWAHLAKTGDPLLVRAAHAAESGGDVAAVLRSGEGAWPDVAAVWAVAVDVGAPLADTLRSAVAALQAATEVRAEVTVALAEPAATARLLTWLPLLGVPLGCVLGLDLLRVVREPFGACCVIGGLMLVGISHVWTSRLARRARPSPGIPGWDAELLALALASGASIDRARELADGHRSLAEAEPPEGVDAALDLSMGAGAPAVDLLRGEAWLARHRARTRGREAAARLSTRLLVPLGVCTLPAFLLLAVVPAVLGIVRSTVVPV